MASGKIRSGKGCIGTAVLPEDGRINDVINKSIKPLHNARAVYLCSTVCQPGTGVLKYAPANTAGEFQ